MSIDRTSQKSKVKDQSNELVFGGAINQASTYTATQDPSSQGLVPQQNPISSLNPSGNARDGGHLQSHSFDYRQQSQVNRIGNYSAFREGSKDQHTNSQAQHPRQAPGDFSSQHSQPRYSHPNQGFRSKNLVAASTSKAQGGPLKQPATGMSKGNLISFDS